MLIGYARVSTQDQDTDAQIKALQSAGCEMIFQEKASGGRWKRPELHLLLDKLRKGDVLVVWKLDRLSRSLKDILVLLDKVKEAKADFCSLTENINTDSPGGIMFLQMVGTFAEYERAMLRERTRNGLDAARQQGRVGGRRHKLKKHQQEEIVSLVSSGQKNSADAARLFNVHPATVSRIMQRHEATAQAQSVKLKNNAVREPVKAKKQTGKVMKVQLWLRVENNNSFVRGKNKSRADIERDVLRQFTMEKPDKDGGVYILSIPYKTDKELDGIIYNDILGEAQSIADMRNGFIEADIFSLDNPERSW